MAGVSLDYSYDGLDAVNRILDQEYQLAFILSPMKPEVIKAIADNGDRMPRKSTYFYPIALGRHRPLLQSGISHYWRYNRELDRHSVRLTLIWAYDSI